MPRRPRSSQLETRTARFKLRVRPKPYYVNVAPGIALGYRRNKSAGSWSAKVADGGGSHWIKAFGIADDHEDADDTNVLNFWQAQDKARAIARGNNNVSGDRPITVGEALDNYAAELKSRNGHDGNIDRVRRDLTPALAAKTVVLLTARDLRHWRGAMLKRGVAPATADRTARVMKAALALAAREDHRITNTAAWRDGLAKLPDTEIARNEILPDPVVCKLVAAAYEIDPAFGLWVEAHAITGARTSQLMRLTVGDLKDDAAPRLIMPSSRKGRRKRIDRKPVPITPALAKALRHAATGRTRGAALLPPPGGTTALHNWFRRAVTAAGLDRKVTPYALRHSSIVRMLLAGTPTRVVAAHHDTSVPMIEKNYSAFIADHTDTLTRRTLLDLGAPADSTVVVPLRGTR